MEKLSFKVSLLKFSAYLLLPTTFILGTPIGLFAVILGVCLVSSLLVMPLVSLPIILLFAGIVSSGAFLCFLMKISLKYLLKIHFHWLIKFNWWCTHLSILVLIVGICHWIVLQKHLPLTPTENYLCAMTGAILGMLSVTLPIIIGNTAKSLSEYQNNIIAGIFKNEVTYKAMIGIVIPLLAIDLILFFFFHNPDYNSNKFINNIFRENCIASFILVSCCYSIYIFIRFIKRFVEYAINTDVVILNKINELIEEKSRENGLSTDYEDYLEVYAQVLKKKGNEKSYVGMSDTFNLLSNYVKRIIELNGKYKYTSNYEGKLRYHRFLRKYSNSYFNIWKMIYIDNPEYTINFSDKYDDIVRNALEKCDQGESDFLLTIYQQFAHEITKDIADSVPLAGIIPWQWFLNIVRNDSFDLSKIHLAGSHLFRVMQVIIKKDNDVSFNLFVSELINDVSRIIGSSEIYSIKDYTVKEEVIRKMRCLYMPGEYNELMKKYNSSIYKEELHNYIRKQFVDNSLSLIVTMIGSYCLFQSRHNLIKIIFEYNQPKYSTTQYINKDILPDDINMLLSWNKEYYNFQSGYFICWDDHHDGSFWLKKYTALLFYRMCEGTKHINMNVDVKYKNKQELEYDKTTLNNIRNEVKDFNKFLIESCGLSFDNRESVLSKIDDLESDVSKEIENKKVYQGLDKEKVEGFENQVINYIKNNTDWVNVFRNATAHEDDPGIIDLLFDISDKRYLDKSFLAEQDFGMYVGFEHSISEIIILKFAFQMENKLRTSAIQNSIDKNSENYLSKENFKTKIKALPADYIVVFINYYLLYDWLSPECFTGVGEAGPMARISGGPEIYSLGDRFNPASRMYLLRKSDFTTVEVDPIQVEVIDLNNNEVKLDHILRNQPSWLSNIPKDDQKIHLRQQVEIATSAKYKLHCAANPEVQLLVNI